VSAGKVVDSIAVYLNLSRRHGEAKDDVEEIRERIFTYSGVMRRAVSGLIKLGNSIFHTRGGFEQLAGDTPGLRIRRCCLRFLTLMGHRGLELEKGETPCKYLSRTAMEDTDAIGLTESYLLARYSNANLSHEDVRAAEKHLERITDRFQEQELS